jgi:hypothetical protein
MGKGGTRPRVFPQNLHQGDSMETGLRKRTAIRIDWEMLKMGRRRWLDLAQLVTQTRAGDGGACAT